MTLHLTSIVPKGSFTVERTPSRFSFISGTAFTRKGATKMRSSSGPKWGLHLGAFVPIIRRSFFFGPTVVKDRSGLRSWSQSVWSSGCSSWKTTMVEAGHSECKRYIPVGVFGEELSSLGSGKSMQFSSFLSYVVIHVVILTQPFTLELLLGSPLKLRSRVGPHLVCCGSSPRLASRALNKISSGQRLEPAAVHAETG